ncbi:hypothetical protein LTR08_009090 [Meristemomyces frigidus]|nr:hypothetical protein LTR08_009090 [Meristemomyces frigidus]
MAQAAKTYDKEAEACEVIVERLQSDRLIRVFIGTGDDAKAFSIQQVLLENISEYFVKSIKHDNLGKEKDSGILRFPDDDIEAWKVLLFWLMRREFPRKAMTGKEELAVSCWVLGDRYGISRFQDEAMLSLLKTMDTAWLGREAIISAFKGTPPGSMLRRAVAEEVVNNLDQGQGLRFTDIDNMLNGLNFAGELFEAQNRYADRESHSVSRHDEIICRFGSEEQEVRPTWEEYMVGKKYPSFAEDVAGYLRDEQPREKSPLGSALG